MDGENTVDYTNTKDCAVTDRNRTGDSSILLFSFLAAIAGGVVFFRRKEDDLWSVRQRYCSDADLPLPGKWSGSDRVFLLHCLFRICTVG